MEAIMQVINVKNVQFHHLLTSSEVMIIYFSFYAKFYTICK